MRELAAIRDFISPIHRYQVLELIILRSQSESIQNRSSSKAKLVTDPFLTAAAKQLEGEFLEQVLMRILSQSISLEFIITTLSGVILKRKSGHHRPIDSLGQELPQMRILDLVLMSKKVRLAKANKSAPSTTQPKCQHLVSVQELNGRKDSILRDLELTDHQVISVT